MSEEQLIIENNYDPSEKANIFHGCDARFIVLVGGLGSGKSRSAIEELVQSGIQWNDMPMAVYRKTMPALRDSTLHEFKTTVPAEIGHYREKAEQYLFQNKSFINFRGLDDPTKAKSTEYALIVMEEADEFSYEDFQFLSQRVRKKGDWPLRIVLVLNPCDEHHWIYQQFVKNRATYEKAGGLLVLHFSTYDNVKHLPEGYIEQVTAGMDADEIDRYINGMWGTIIKGKPIYGKLINPDLHFRRFVGVPTILLRGWDFGFNRPACSFRLKDEYGRMNIAYEMLGEKEEFALFVRRVKAQTEVKFGKVLSIQDYGDPRGHDRGQATADTCFDVLQNEGIYATGERGCREYVEPGIKQVRNELSRLIEGIPELTIDPIEAPLLKAAYMAKYVRGDDGRPYKDGFYEHICDADRYISHHHKHTDAVKQAMEKRQQKKFLLPGDRRRIYRNRTRRVQRDF